MLLAVFLLAAIGAAIATTLLLISVSSVQTTGSIQDSLQAKWFANSCAEAGLNQIVADVEYLGNGSLTFPTGACTYVVAQHDATSDVIRATGTVGNIIRRVAIVILVPQRSIQTWQEVTGF